MSKNSEAVKNWRKNTKKRMIEAMGGCCQICKYNNCNEALSFHHLDPTLKKFQFGKIRANCKSWNKIVEELRKCILLCERCHIEVHNGVLEIPEKYETFNEEYADYLKNQKEESFDNCPVCGNKKPLHQKTCSYKCAAKLSRKVDWDNINLVKMLKSGKSYSKIADMCGCSCGNVIKRCKRLGLEKHYCYDIIVDN